MDARRSPQSFFLLLVVVVLGLLASAMFYMSGGRRAYRSSSGGTPEANSVTNLFQLPPGWPPGIKSGPIVKVDSDRAPQGFPDVPPPLGATPVENFTLGGAKSNGQMTRVFESGSSVAQNLSFYKNYFSASSAASGTVQAWKLVSVSSTISSATLKARSAQGLLVIRISAMGGSGSFVDVIFLQLAAAPKSASWRRAAGVSRASMPLPIRRS